MKNYKSLLIIFLMLLGFGVSAQEIEHNGTKYYIKGKQIIKDGEIVTDKLAPDARKSIMTKFDNKMKLEADAKDREKALRSAEKKAEKIEKELKKAERELKEKQKLQERFDRASGKLEDAQKKYARLKRKGKLSPNEEENWLSKIDNLQDDVEKYKKKLRKS